MALILKEAVKLYYYLNEEIADPKTKDWFLIQTPWPGLAILFIYLLTVVRWLPNYMNERQPYDLRLVIAIFNVCQIFSCSYVVYQSLKLGWLSHYSLLCQPVDNGADGVEYAWKVCYGYFVIKMFDLLDTIFFVLRKKQNQVTFLHVYHHFGMVIVGWSVVKWVPGGHISLLLMVNSFVHVIMYLYYLLSTWDETYKKSIWWKKHVTQIQILQFTIVILHFFVQILTPNCNFPKQPAYILIPQNLFMVILFGDFYYHTYIKSSKKD